MKELLIGFGGAALGFASGLLVPWVKWEIEKRQKRLETRRELVLAWRRAIEPIDFSCDLESRTAFGDSHAYARLRANMREDVIKQFEASGRTIYAAGGRGSDVLKQMLLDEVARLEKEWGLA